MPAISAPPNDPRPLVLLVEDEDGVRRSLQLLLVGSGYRVRAFAASAPVIADRNALEAALLLADYRLPDSNGLQLLSALRAAGWGGRAILITAYPSPALREAARAAGFETIIHKPLRQQELLNALRPAN